jgi:hypothetical protein
MNAVPDDNAIRLTGIEALNKALGYAGALRFLALVHREPTDYAEISRKLYEGQTVDEIFDRASDQWRGQLG